MAKQHVLHCLPSLTLGGAERFLQRLLQQHPMGQWHHHVVVLHQRPPQLSLPQAVSLTPFHQCLRARPASWPESFALLHGHTYLGNLMAWGLQWRYGQGKLIWTIHNEGPLLHAFSYKTLVAAQLHHEGQHRVDHLIYVAWQSAFRHRAANLQPAKCSIIPIGVERPLSTANSPNLHLRSATRSQLGLPIDQPLLLHIGRWDPIKDHATMLRAFCLLHEELRTMGRQTRPHLLLVGPTPEQASTLQQHLPAPIQRYFHVIGPKLVEQQMWACDPILCLSSQSEACPTVLLEAWAHQCASVATWVGDAPYLTPHRHRLVPPRQPKALAQALRRILEDHDPQNLKSYAPPWMPPFPQALTLPHIAQRYAAVYHQLLPHP